MRLKEFDFELIDGKKLISIERTYNQNQIHGTSYADGFALMSWIHSKIRNVSLAISDFSTI
jgi:hypothetical protein